MTVDAFENVIEREVLGIAEAMRSFGQRRTPYAMLSHRIVGTIGKTFARKQRALERVVTRINFLFAILARLS